MTTAPSPSTKPLDRDELFELWVRDIRDPADSNNEGVRTLRTTNGKAMAEYKIALLPNGHYALLYSYGYHCGDYTHHGNPWISFATREECLELFLDHATSFFSRPAGLMQGQTEETEELAKSPSNKARKQMLALLNNEGLFGFIEPDPVSTSSSDSE